MVSVALIYEENLTNQSLKIVSCNKRHVSVCHDNG